MFSSTTIAASTTIPTAKASPAREMTLIDLPRAAIATNEPTMETGIASTTVVVARHDRRNTSSTRAASAPPTYTFCCTRSRAESMYTVSS